MSAKWKFAFLFLFLYAFHAFFGLAQAQWWERDEFQTYLIGLKFHTSGAWPFFGPDVNGIENQSFQSQIPGAMEGLLIGLPFTFLPIPEAPYLFLNFLTVLGAAILAWYIQKRIPRLSLPLLFLWICVTPWTLHKAAHIINPAYDFLPSVLFFIGFMETIPYFSMKFIPLPWCNAAMGFSLFWIMQFHFSYVYFIPLAGVSLLVQFWGGRRVAPALFFLAGALPTAGLIIPTFLKYGLARSNVASGFEVPFNWYNVSEWLTILARYFSLVCFELPRFIGTTLKARVDYLNLHPWLWLPGWILWIGGILQAVAMLFIGLFKWKHPVPGWDGIRWFILLVYLMIWASFWFTIKLPLSHIYLVFYPWLMLYSCYCWSLFADKKWGGAAAKAFLALALYFQVGYAWVALPNDSFYSKRPDLASINRDVVVRALKEKNYKILGERRPGSLY